MSLFRHWTKQHKIIGVILGIITAINLLANTFFSDYELAKEQALLEGQEVLLSFEENQYTEYLAQQNALDEELRTSADDTMLKEEVVLRDEYVALQQAFIDATRGAANDKIDNDVSSLIIEDGNEGAYFTALYTEGNDIDTGYVQFINNNVNIYRYTYNGGKVTVLDKVGQYEMQEVQIIEE